MKNVCIHIKSHADVDTVSSFIELLNQQILYSSESEEGLKQIFVSLNESFDVNLLTHPDILSIEPYILPDIDWTSQFEQHGLNYHDGYVHVDLKDFGCLNPKVNPIKLIPGPGFGDLSHPTTHLVLKLMPQFVKNQNVLDIGCGSGILSLAAASMHASSVFGIDIDDAVISHSIENASLNHLEKIVSFGKNFDYQNKNNNLVILMNMIQKEQMEAYESLKQIHHIKGDILTSGILKKDKAKYLRWTKLLNWKLISCIEQDGWLGFHFQKI